MLNHHKILLASAAIFLSGCNFEVEVSEGGRVVSDPSGIDCRASSGECVITNYEKLGDGNDKVITTLTAIADEHYQLSHWEGDCIKTERHQCKVSMQGELYVKAVFEPIPLATAVAPTKTTRFIAMGDTGTGGVGQYFVADAILEICEAAGGCEFVTGLGDNIYDENPLYPHDTAFDSRFELPYNKLSMPFFMALGNHDNDILIDGTGGSNIAGDIQVKYHYREDRLSDKWQMPARYYHYSAPLEDDNPLVDFYVLDSNPMNSAPDLNPAYEVNYYKGVHGDWIDDQLSQSKAPWKIAYAHHPYLSNGKHGNAGRYDGLLPLEAVSKRISGAIYKEWFEEHICGKVDVFIAGHDHDMQLLQSVPECGKTWFIVSGAGAKTRDFKDRNRNVAYWQEDNTLGFFLIEITGNDLKIDAYTVSGTDGLYEKVHSQMLPRRQ